RRRFAKPLYGPKPVSRVRIPASPTSAHTSLTLSVSYGRRATAEVVHRSAQREGGRTALAKIRFPGPDARPTRSIRAITHRLPARRRRADRVVQLALRAAARRRVRAPHRGHRRRAIVGRDGGRYSRRHAVARPRLGRGAEDRRPARAVLSIRALRSPSRAGGRSRAPGARLSLLLHARGTAGAA